MASRMVVLVTGGNNGIGYEAVKALLESTNAYHILFGTRLSRKASLQLRPSTRNVQCRPALLNFDREGFRASPASPGHPRQ
ncbi:hypothetical protein V1517DRAFT_176341 [Lipomyces orientalis]|uniref:Uncharacterized protein n=1 Tax=Lipomyces orientalis TaxID=1233043 RepID=A0ACC3TJJ7_9ASCO